MSSALKLLTMASQPGCLKQAAITTHIYYYTISSRRRVAVLRHICRPCTICRQRQIVSPLAAHFVAPMHNLTPGDKMCRSGRYGFGVTKCAV